MKYYGWKDVVVGASIATAARASVIEGRAAAPDTVQTWKDWTCPLPSTVSLSFTEYVPVTTTQNQTATTTIYQTVVSTEIITTVQSTAETAITTSPLTLTATVEEELFTVTSKATSLVICPTRIINPTFTLASPLPNDWTWGCPPGWLCKPKQEGCNFEAGLPDRGFYCAPNECIPAEALPAVLPTWDTTIYGNDSSSTNPALTYDTIDDFFNMDPEQFGLTYEIFVVNKVITYTSTTTILPASPTVAARQAQTSIPGACYPWCNNCLLEAQSAGKSPNLCQPGSAFVVSFTSCEECINVHKDDSSGSFVQIAPQFQQFLDYCARYSTAVISTTMTLPTSIGQSTFSTVVATTAATIVPTQAASSYSTLLSTSITESFVMTATLISSSVAPPPPSTPSSSAAPPPSSAAPPSSAVPSSSAASASSAVQPTTVAPTSTASLTPVAATTIPASSAVSHSQIIYTITSAMLTTSTAPAVTYNGTDITSITIIMSSNGTAVTISGSELSTYTVVIPTSTVVTSYETTMTMTSSGGALVASTSGGALVPSTSGGALVPSTSVDATSAPEAVPASSAAGASTSAFTGNAAAGIIPSGGQTFLSVLFGFLVMLI